jgi:hypothetical protein
MAQSSGGTMMRMIHVQDHRMPTVLSLRLNEARESVEALPNIAHSGLSGCAKNFSQLHFKSELICT